MSKEVYRSTAIVKDGTPLFLAESHTISLIRQTAHTASGSDGYCYIVSWTMFEGDYADNTQCRVCGAMETALNILHEYESELCNNLLYSGVSFEFIRDLDEINKEEF